MLSLRELREELFVKYKQNNREVRGEDQVRAVPDLSSLSPTPVLALQQVLPVTISPTSHHWLSV